MKMTVIGLGLSCICLCFFLKCQKLTGALAPVFISEEDEIELGNQFYKQILSDKQQYPIYDGNQRVLDFVDSLGMHIVEAQNDRDISFTFDIIDDTLVNAFAVPGGHVFIYRGLLEKVRNTAEIAGVIAHEVGHITRYHGRDLLLQQTFVSDINTILFGGDSSSISGAITSLLENMVFLKFSREKEEQADSCSVVYTTNAGINPRGMKSFLTLLKDLYGETPEFFEPLSDHPPLSDRISNVQDVIDNTFGVPSSGECLFEKEYEQIKELL